ncbi:hypothetical protein [Cupriavidus basilensis]|uniref:hypothetical protein n=1 Tax=Cupriavidus basilensis TaxID=68895 RepID=UPI0005BC0BDB|nr:hypothetical protein [Cupriavidus basilensis]
MYAVLYWLEQHDKLSGWVQFLGAMIGIFIAIAVPAVQTHSSKKMDRRDKAQALRATVEVIRIGAKLATTAHTAVKGPTQGRTYFPNDYDPSHFAHALQLLDGIEVHRLPTPGAVKAVVDARHRMSTFTNAVGEGFREFGHINEVSQAVLDRLDEAHTGLVKDVNELLNECRVIELGRAK